MSWLRCLWLPTLLATLASSVGATWSIVIVDRRTGEVGVATATCLTGPNIRRTVPVIVVGKGAAAADTHHLDFGAGCVVIFSLQCRFTITDISHLPSCSTDFRVCCISTTPWHICDTQAIRRIYTTSLR